jgi:hypothetical protein
MKRKKVSVALEKKLRLVRTTVADLARVKGGAIWPTYRCGNDCGYTRGGYGYGDCGE